MGTRAGGHRDRRLPKLGEWERGDRSPTLKQLEDFAQATHTPVGFLLLPQPPSEQVPIPDYRTMSGVGVRRPSPDLLDAILQCQRRQEWYRDFAQLTQEDPVAVVGSLTRYWRRQAGGVSGASRLPATYAQCDVVAPTLGSTVTNCGVVGL